MSYIHLYFIPYFENASQVQLLDDDEIVALGEHKNVLSDIEG